MEESKALAKLNEAADLLGLLEDVLNPNSVEKLSQASWSGLRLTLKNARQTVQESQITLSKEFVARARNSGMVAPVASASELPAKAAFVPSENPATNSDASRVQITRRDLKASLEKFIEGRQ